MLPRSSHRVRSRIIPGALIVLWTAGPGTVRALPVPTTLADFQLPGSQPGQSGSVENPATCAVCHGNYAVPVEPQFGWRGSMMAQAARDPLFYAALAIANQDAAQSGDLCIRCHTPGGWLEGRSTPTDGSALTAADREGVSCAICHGLVRPSLLGTNPYPGDPAYTTGTYGLDQTYLGTLAAVPPVPSSGMYIVDSSDSRRGPRTGLTSPHSTIYSPFHSEALICATCHDVSNPVYSRDSTGTYALNALGQPAPSGNPYEMFPIERTFSEWQMSAYASTPGGIYAPQFGGNKTNVSTCQDCHMRDATGKACNRPNAPVRTDLATHDLTGGNTFIPRLVAALYPSEVDTTALQAGIERARYMLQHAASLDLEVSPLWNGWRARVRVTNETGHKLPSGYPEGRRMWLHVRAWDDGGALVFESGGYDSTTATLAADPQIKVYESRLGLSPATAAATGLPAGPSFHFVLNDRVEWDNRIPPRGFTNAGFTTVQASPVGVYYTDGQHWDDTFYDLPAAAQRVTVVLRYQTASREYIEFLRDTNTTDNTGMVLYTQWAAHGKSSPEAMAAVSDTLVRPTDVQASGGVVETLTLACTARPGSVDVTLAMPRAGHVRITVHDVRSRRVAVVADGDRAAGPTTSTWQTRGMAHGIYWIRAETKTGRASRKVFVH